MGRPFEEPEDLASRPRATELHSDNESDSDTDDSDESEVCDYDEEDDADWDDPSQGNILTLLLRACELGDHPELDQLLPLLNVSLDVPGEDSDTLLHTACLYGHLECCRRLLDAGASAGALDEDGATPLHDAAAGGYRDICELLLDADETILHAVDADGDTPLHAAARGDHVEMVKFLLERGANPLIENMDHKYPRALCSRGSEVEEILLKAEEGR